MKKAKKGSMVKGGGSAKCTMINDQKVPSKTTAAGKKISMPKQKDYPSGDDNLKRKVKRAAV